MRFIPASATQAVFCVFLVGGAGLVAHSWTKSDPGSQPHRLPMPLSSAPGSNPGAAAAPATTKNSASAQVDNAKAAVASTPLSASASAPSAEARFAPVVLVPRADTSSRLARIAAPVAVEHVDGDRQREMAATLQNELRRVGCFDAETTGTWGAASKKAMSDFLVRVNATLPFDAPDVILLTLVRGHAGKACGVGCAAGQMSLSNGKCIPALTLAQGRKVPKVLAAAAPERAPAPAPKVVRVAGAETPAIHPTPSHLTSRHAETRPAAQKSGLNGHARPVVVASGEKPSLGRSDKRAVVADTVSLPKSVVKSVSKSGESGQQAWKIAIYKPDGNTR